VDELDAKQVAELARDPSITTAPDMPVELIAPRAVTALSNGVDALDPVAWPAAQQPCVSDTAHVPRFAGRALLNG
jgi:hypothetical protein